jgi:o-succinylbenzoate synthase
VAELLASLALGDRTWVSGRPAVTVNALLTAESAGAAAHEARLARNAGFQTVKLKVGVLSDLAAEQARVAAVREAIGPDVRLRLDANGAWNEQQAVETLRALEPCDIEYVEQPVPAGDIATLKRVQDAVATPIAADEDVTGLDAALAVLEARAARLLVLKPQAVGGLLTARRIIEAASAAGVRCVVTTSIDTGVGTAAALQLAATCPGNRAHGLATLDLLEGDLIRGPGLPVERGWMALPASAGLPVWRSARLPVPLPVCPFAVRWQKPTFSTC